MLAYFVCWNPPVFNDPELSAILAAFRHERLIDSYLGPLRPGKESHIHCCRRPDGGYAILKHYTPISVRSFRADAAYGLGTGRAKPRVQRAIRNTSEFGLRSKLAVWTGNEERNARHLLALGLRIPEPLGRHGPALLMRMIGGPDQPAAQLREAALDAASATALVPLLQADIATMLRHGLVHGDLSAYNVLWHRGRHWLIDVPQMVHAQDDPLTHELFLRDCRCLLGHLQRCGAAVDAATWAADVWARWRAGDPL